MSKVGKYARALLRDAERRAEATEGAMTTEEATMSSADDHEPNDAGSVPPNASTVTPYEGGAVPDGHVVLRDQHGNEMLLDVEAAKAARDREQLSELTPDQVRRIEAFKRVFAEQDLTTLEEALANFARDMVPEREIRVWERMAAVYTLELQDRPNADAAERRLLYATIMACSFFGGREEVLEHQPDGVQLPDLDRVLQRWSR